MRNQEESLERGENGIEIDSRFHMLMAKTTKNRIMERLLLAMIDLIRQSREKYHMEDENNRRARRSLEGHRRVFCAIKRGDSAEALQSMLSHLEDIEEIIFQK